MSAPVKADWVAIECPKCQGSGEYRRGTRPGACFLCKGKRTINRLIPWGAEGSEVDKNGHYRGNAPEFTCDGGWGY